MAYNHYTGKSYRFRLFLCITVWLRLQDRCVSFCLLLSILGPEGQSRHGGLQEEGTDVMHQICEGGVSQKNETQRILASIQLRKFIAQIRVYCKPHNEFLMILLEGLWCFGNLTTTLTWTRQQQTGAKSMFSRKYKQIQWAVENMAHLNQVFKLIKLPFVLEQWLHNGELRN